MEQATEKRGTRKERVGIVVGDSMAKTIVVEVKRRKRHKMYSKEISLSRRFHAHDDKNEAKCGDRVKIAETRPISRMKHWRLVEILDKS